MRFLKIKLLKKETAMIWENQNSSGGYDNFEFKTAEKPDPKFDKAVRELGPHIAKICEIENTKQNPVTGYGISFSYNDELGKNGVNLSGRRKLKNSNNDMNLTTPLKYVPGPTDKLKDNIAVPEEVVKELEKIIKLAKQFMKGQRAQNQLFD